MPTQANASTVSAERRLLRENRSAAAVLYVAVGAALMATALWFAMAWLIAETVNRVFLLGQDQANLRPLFAIMLALAIARSALVWTGDVVAQKAANSVKSRLRDRLGRKLIDLGPIYVRGERVGELVHAAVRGIEALDPYMTQYLPARLLAGLVPVLLLAVVFYLDPWTLPILLFAGPILLILLALIGGRTRDLAQKRERELAWMSAHFIDVLQGLPTLKMFGRSKEQGRTIEAVSRRYGKMTMDVLGTAFQTSLVLEWGATAATAMVAIEVSVRLMNGLLPFDRALTLLILTPEFFLPLRQLALHYHAGSAGAEAAGRVYAILDTPAASTRLTADLASTSRPQASRTPASALIESGPGSAPMGGIAIGFEDVHFAYDNGHRPALNGLTLKLEAGQTLALVGATGSGKTTVANLLLRFIEPDHGRILVAGGCLSDLDPDSWRTNIAWVPQHPYLFYGSVADNLRLGAPRAGMDELVAAARAVHAHDFIAELPHAYETLLGEQGARLSGGQVQRLAIARALLKNAPLLILDEATSHLDQESEALVKEALCRLMKDRTVLIIAHQPALAGNADAIAVMDHGRVIETKDRRPLGGELKLDDRVETRK